MVCKRLFIVQVNSVLEFMDMVMEMSQGHVARDKVAVAK